MITTTVTQKVSRKYCSLVISVNIVLEKFLSEHSCRCYLELPQFYNRKKNL